MDYNVLANLLFPHVTETPEEVEARFPARQLPEGAVVSRMAPSPTGFVHLGNLVQGTISERMSHQSGGTLFLRVEDTDAKREVPGAVLFMGIHNLFQLIFILLGRINLFLPVVCLHCLDRLQKY